MSNRRRASLMLGDNSRNYILASFMLGDNSRNYILASGRSNNINNAV